MVEQLADMWVDYQLLGHAAAEDDSLNSKQVMDSALWGTEMNQRAQKWFDPDLQDVDRRRHGGLPGRVCERQGAGSAAHSPDDTAGRHDDRRDPTRSIAKRSRYVRR